MARHWTNQSKLQRFLDDGWRLAKIDVGETTIMYLVEKEYE